MPRCSFYDFFTVKRDPKILITELEYGDGRKSYLVKVRKEQEGIVWWNTIATKDTLKEAEMVVQIQANNTVVRESIVREW